MSDYKLMDLADLDEVSFDEVDKIIARYEDLRAIVEARLKKIGSLYTTKTYKDYDDMLGELSQNRDVKKRRAIAKQIRDEHLKAEN